MFIIGTACSFIRESENSERNILAFETLLNYNKHLNQSSKYLSFYIREELPKKTIRKIKRSFDENYRDHEIYLYTDKDLMQAGP